MRQSDRKRLKSQILEFVEMGSTLTTAARACGINRETIRRWRNTDAIFGCQMAARLLTREIDRLEAKLGIL